MTLINLIHFIFIQLIQWVVRELCTQYTIYNSFFSILLISTIHRPAHHVVSGWDSNWIKWVRKWRARVAAGEWTTDRTGLNWIGLVWVWWVADRSDGRSGSQSADVSVGGSFPTTWCYSLSCRLCVCMCSEWPLPHHCCHVQWGGDGGELNDMHDHFNCHIMIPRGFRID